MVHLRFKGVSQIDMFEICYLTMEQVLQHYCLAPLLIDKVIYINSLLTWDELTFTRGVTKRVISGAGYNAYLIILPSVFKLNTTIFMYLVLCSLEKKVPYILTFYENVTNLSTIFKYNYDSKYSYPRKCFIESINSSIFR
jgi:hypothetical protein